MAKRYWLTVITVIIAVPAAWYLISPLFVNRRINEGFPAAQATAAMADAMAEPDKPMGDPMPEKGSAVVTLVAEGNFYDLAHHGMGTAAIYQYEGGSHVLRFEDFEVLNGPDLHVYFSTVDPVPDTVGLALEGGIDLGLLKGNIGNQNYELPADLDLSQYRSVVIWCEPFRVPFNAAPLNQP